MTDETKQSFDENLTDSGGNRKNKKGIKLFLIISASVLVAALAVCAWIFTGNTYVSQDRILRVIEYGTVLSGVSVDGIDLSGMTESEARDATAKIEQDMLSEAALSLDVDGQLFEYTSADFDIYTDYDKVIADALAYGHSGTFDERKAAADKARGEGVNFAVDVYVDEAKVKEMVTALKVLLDAEPQEPGVVFTPWGHLADGTPYEPTEDEIIEMIKAHAREKEYETPELVRIPDEEKPNDLRYEYYRNTKFIEDYIPEDAYISRFYYTGDQKGLIIDFDATVELIVGAVASDDYSTITVPVDVTETDVDISEIKNKTQLIASWTSCYSNHASYARNYNVGKLSSILNGVIIEPGEEWSINEEAGPRNRANGWQEAAGISNGAFTEQYGGGVCQLSSTTYNAALRTGLEIIDSSRHTIISDYIPLGLDATISTGGPDLVLKNPYDTPVYIVSYVNGDDENVTVEMYGAPIVHETYGEIILDFSFKDLGHSGSGSMTTYYNSPTTPDGKAVPAGGSVEYAKARSGRKVQTYIHYLALDGTELAKDELYYHYYKPVNGRTYFNGPNPALATPTPAPATSPPATSPPATSPPATSTPETSTPAP